MKADSITLPEFWVWKLSESGPAEIARKVGNLPEFCVWKLPEIKASFFAAALKKQGIFSCYCKALSPICCSYECCSACYIDSIQKLSLLQLLLKKIRPLPYTLPLLIPTCMQLHISVSHAAKQGGKRGKNNLGAKAVPISLISDTKFKDTFRANSPFWIRANSPLWIRANSPPWIRAK